MTTETWLLLLAALLAGILFGIVGYRLWLRSRFRVVLGEIESARIASKVGKGGRRLYGVEVRYRYQVGDRPYVGRTIAPDYHFSERDEPHLERLQRYRVGEQVPVYYNPSNPEEAYLEYGFPKLLLLLAAVALLFLLVVIVVLLQKLNQLGGGAV